MILYKNYIKLMEERGYSYEGVSVIDESIPNIKIFTVPKLSIGKVLELKCLDNFIVSVCGNTHDGGCTNLYSVNIQCFNEDNKEPFQDLHRSIRITDGYHVIAELVVTKILTKEPDKNNVTMQEWLEKTNPILRAIGIENPYEYLMWHGIYKSFSKEFLNTSFNLYPNEKMIFYVINPEVDIVKVKFNLKADILEKKRLDSTM